MRCHVPKGHRRSIRLRGYDYSQNGAYFITVCTKNRECVFGEILNDDTGKKYFAPTNLGGIAEQCWQEIPKHYPFVVLDEFVVMPNHIHGILFLNSEVTRKQFERDFRNNVGVQNLEPLQMNRFQKIIPGSIGAIVRGYKIGVTKWCRENTNTFTIWQRNYYEHIIRNDEDLNRIREYIINNPANWEKDELFHREIRN